MSFPEILCLCIETTDNVKDFHVPQTGVGGNEQTGTETSTPTPTVLWKPSSPVKKEALYFESVPSYHEFFMDIFLKNQLCILGPQCTESWASRKLWVTHRGTPHFDFLGQHFGNAIAPVTNCNASDCSSEKRIGMTVSDFIEHWEQIQSDEHAANNQCLYLKDWHFTRDFPSFHAYSPPLLLCSDWLNEFWDVRQDAEEAEGAADDYRFVYMGPKDTWTPFHSDVLRSYSWSANICGRKKWIFFPPGDENLLRDSHGQLIADLRDPELEDWVKYPHAEGVLSTKGIEVIQHPGEIVFVPSGWHHQVFNLEDTISINHNWVNGCSVHLTWAFLKSQMAKVKDEIADCAGMEGFDTQCQKVLKADIGMDYIEFYNFMATIATHRLCALDVFYQHVTNGIDSDSSHTDSDDTPRVKSTKTKYNTPKVYLCLWSAALYDSSKLWTKTNKAKPHNNSDIKRNIIVSQSDQITSCPLSETPAVMRQGILKSKNCDSLEVSVSEQKDNDYKSLSSKLRNISSSESEKFKRDNISEFSESNIQNDKTEILSNTESKTFGVSKSVGFKCDKMRTSKEFQNNIISERRDSIGVDRHCFNHDLCPHWAHCGCRLAVFDLQRVADILHDVTHQPEWKNILEQAVSDTQDVGNLLVEDFNALASRIERCLGKVVEYLS